METRANYALIGAFVLFAAAAVLGFTLWLGATQFSRDTAAYEVIFEGPVSLEEGAAVRYIGIKVGEVETVRIDRRDASKVRARLRIDRTTPVKEDSTASIEIAGITGVTFVQINAGSQNAPPLRAKPQQDVPVIRSVPNPISELFASGAEIAGRTGLFLEQGSALLSDDNIETFGSLLRHADSVLQTVAAEDEQLLAEVRATLASLDEAGADISLAAEATSAAAEATQAEIKALSADLKLAIADLRSATGAAEAGFAEAEAAIGSARALIEGPAAQTLNDSQAAAQDLRALVARIDGLVRDIDANPQGLIIGQPRPYEEPR